MRCDWRSWNLWGHCELPGWLCVFEGGRKS